MGGNDDDARPAPDSFLTPAFEYYPTPRRARRKQKTETARSFTAQVGWDSLPRGWTKGWRWRGRASGFSRSGLKYQQNIS